MYEFTVTYVTYLVNNLSGGIVNQGSDPLDVLRAVRQVRLQPALEPSLHLEIVASLSNLEVRSELMPRAPAAEPH